MLLICLTLFSCVTRKDVIGQVSDCPEDGKCRFEYHKNTSLIIKKDDLGSLYHQTEVSSGKSVFVYKFEQNIDQAYVDGHYVEEIIFEIDNNKLQNDFQDYKPNQIMFGVFCYCKGKAGYYQTDNSRISFDKKTNKITITIGEVIEDQLLKTVAFSF